MKHDLAPRITCSTSTRRIHASTPIPHPNPSPLLHTLKYSDRHLTGHNPTLPRLAQRQKYCLLCLHYFPTTTILSFDNDKEIFPDFHLSDQISDRLSTTSTSTTRLWCYILHPHLTSHTMAPKRDREDDAQVPHVKKVRGGFKVGPDNLPDGTWRRKGKPFPSSLSSPPSLPLLSPIPLPPP